MLLNVISLIVFFFSEIKAFIVIEAVCFYFEKLDYLHVHVFVWPDREQQHALLGLVPFHLFKVHIVLD